VYPTQEHAGVSLATRLQEQYTTGLQEQATPYTPPWVEQELVLVAPGPAPVESANIVCNEGRGNFSPLTTAKSFGSTSGWPAVSAWGRSFGFCCIA
jgi:hypothetical protein